MSSWRDEILTHFEPKTAALTVVADPDGLLVEEGIVNGIRARGFGLIPFDDPVAFRFTYESQYRHRRDQGESAELVVVLRSEDDELRKLPFDLVQAARRLPTFRLARIFPKLSNPVLQIIDRSLLDRLFKAYASYDGGELGDRATKDFILRKVFRTAADSVSSLPDLLRVLCEKHSRREPFPAVLDDHLVEVWRNNPAFASWPLEQIVPDREAFLRFLQEKWPDFVSTLAARLGEPPASGEIPFDEARAYIDTFFLEGALHPVPFDQPERLPEWAKAGVFADPMAAAIRRLAALVGRLEHETPSRDAVYREWQHFAWKWGELKVLQASVSGAIEPAMSERIGVLHDSVEHIFGEWMVERFGGLANLVERDGRPIMLHHVGHYLADRRSSASESRVALIVIDGMAIDQWLTIKNEVARALPAIHLDESAVFAWVPTLTSVSRQSIFAGEIPLLFADSLSTTAKEESHWRRMWDEFDVPASSVAYRKGLGMSEGTGVEDLLQNPNLRVLGLVVNTVDDIMHGMMLGAVGMQESVRLWATNGYLVRLVDQLLTAGFAVYLTADHGNVEALGQGRPREGALVETKGERARVYESDLFRDQVRKEYPNTILWPGAGLPSHVKPLLAAGRTAFVKEGEQIVGHGGIAIEEVLVPFVRMWRE